MILYNWFWSRENYKKNFDILTFNEFYLNICISQSLSFAFAYYYDPISCSRDKYSPENVDCVHIPQFNFPDIQSVFSSEKSLS